MLVRNPGWLIALIVGLLVHSCEVAAQGLPGPAAEGWFVLMAPNPSGESRLSAPAPFPNASAPTQRNSLLWKLSKQRGGLVQSMSLVPARSAAVSSALPMSAAS